MSNKVKYKAKFLDEWLENSDFKDWIQKRQKDTTCAFCKYKPFVNLFSCRSSSKTTVFS